METFRVRLNCVDHYQGAVTDFDPPVARKYSKDGKDNPKVPIIRVFGSTPTGQKVCVHVHGMFPYLYVQYMGGLHQEDVKSYIQRLSTAINHALALAFRTGGQGRVNYIYVAHISLVKGVPFYGFHVGYRYFLKIYLFNPGHIIRLSDLLRQGAVLMRPMQPYESHMQYVPQWMADYNLYGCAFLDCTKFRFRSPVPRWFELDDKNHSWHDRSIHADFISDDLRYPRQSHCPLELDVCVQDIANRKEINERRIHQDFSQKGANAYTDEKLVPSMAGLWRDETKRRKARMGLVDSDSSPFPPEALITVSADPRSSSPGGWIHEDEYRELVDQLIVNERKAIGPIQSSFSNFVEHGEDFQWIPTAFESITELYPDNFQDDATLAQESGIRNDAGRAEVDESQILDMHADGDSFYSDDDSNDQAEPSGETSLGASADLLPTKLSQPKSNGINASNGEILESVEPQSSAELENHGIRKANNYGHIQDDAFDIDPEYQSGIRAALVKTKEKARLAETAPFSPKRRKIELSSSPSKAISLSSKRMVDVLAADSKIQQEKEIAALSQIIDRLSARNSQPRNTPRQGRKNSDVSDHENTSILVRPSQPSQTSDQKHVSFDASVKDSDHETLGKESEATITDSPRPRKIGRLEYRLLAKFFPAESTTVLCYRLNPPKISDVLNMGQFALPSEIHQGAFYGYEADVPERIREYAGKGFKLQSNTVPYLPDFDTRKTYKSETSFIRDGANIVAPENDYLQDRRFCTLTMWQVKAAPPTRIIVDSWLENETSISAKPTVVNDPRPVQTEDNSQSQSNKHGFKYSPKHKESSVKHETQYMSIMSLEVHINTRDRLLPDPEKDEIECIFWSLLSDGMASVSHTGVNTPRTGVVVYSRTPGLGRKISQHVRAEVEEEETELDLLNKIITVVRDCDPDVITGFEVHNGSWGYLIERARVKYEFDLCSEFSRTKSASRSGVGRGMDKWGFNQTSTIRVTGRHMINIWRAMQGELNLLQYTMENIVYHLLRRRVPHYAFSDLTKWYKSSNPRENLRVVDYYLSRVRLDLEIVENNELVPRTSEQARLLGVDFYSVFARGSQFKVESLMFRLAKPENLLLVSPSRKQVGSQNALECLPLVMEPQSAFYPDPLLVLDFQSLYPSVMIAYNYCYSTFLGRVVNWQGRNKMGFTDYQRQEGLLELLRDYVNIAPNGIIYVKPSIRKSLLAKMLGEILETRVMVKSGMKVDKDDNTLQRLLNNRQLALKLIANVTYGYTSASFSGRMPCSEIADSIVQTARETLEKAVALIHSVKRWDAEVVYGDTDSLFVSLKGRTRDEAFVIGEEIRKAVTDINPRPVKLKFEKVYHPCVLLAKKRYVGFKYESRKQKVPDFDAKGIETVRRDGTPAEQKIEERALKILFRTADLSQVKAYFQKQCMKIMKGKVSIQDFCFAKEVRLGTYSDRGVPPPGALISTRKMLEDHRAEPQYGERVPYVVITGAPGARLIDRCVAPEVLLGNDHKELDADYYISKNIIPPLERIFNLVGANVRQWYDEMPKHQRVRRIEGLTEVAKETVAPHTKTLESYMKATACVVCSGPVEEGFSICTDCQNQAPKSLLAIRQRLQADEQTAVKLQKICRSCAALPFGDEVKCDSKDCPMFYTRTRHAAAMQSSQGIMMRVSKLLEAEDSIDLSW